MWCLNAPERSIVGQVARINSWDLVVIECSGGRRKIGSRINDVIGLQAFLWLAQTAMQCIGYLIEFAPSSRRGIRTEFSAAEMVSADSSEQFSPLHRPIRGHLAVSAVTGPRPLGGAVA